MDAQWFNSVAEERIQKCRDTLLAKGEEYARNGERLHNFKSAAMIDGETPEQALWGMAKKHVISVRDMITDVEQGKLPSFKLIDDKITDWINYGLLLEGLLVERIAKQPITIDADQEGNNKVSSAIDKVIQENQSIIDEFRKDKNFHYNNALPIFPVNKLK